ncbi:hypothetical protein ID866_10530, partial [Astraeus odoratus]
FLLLALLPIPQFIHPVTHICSVLEAQLLHQCLAIILDPLKIAACIGCMMSDPAGNVQFCYTPLVSYIVDIPKACMLACIQGLTSLVTLAMCDNFGDLDRHPPCTAAITLDQLNSITCDPADIDQYFTECKPFCLSSVSHPFWHDWALSHPLQFLTPEPLHHWHHEFWDHDVHWCTQVLGATELDFCFLVLPPITGLHHFIKASPS